MDLAIAEGMAYLAALMDEQMGVDP